MRLPPPRDEAELHARARELRGRTFGEIAAALGVRLEDDPRRTKGKLGELLERALGATPGPPPDLTPTTDDSEAADEGRFHDFPQLGVELKSLPLDGRGLPKESTYVCRLSLRGAAAYTWETSWVRAKLQRVLWIAFDGAADAWWDRCILHAFFWTPSAEEDAELRADFDEVVGLFARGEAEAVTAHLGRSLQVRPKARHGGVRVPFVTSEGQTIATIPRGFYLRPTFTARLLPGAPVTAAGPRP